MKKAIFFLLIMQAVCTVVLCQSVGIGTGTPDASAQLDITSNTKGILIPRMSAAERTTISSPATGLLVFDNNSNSFWFYNGSAWSEITGGSNTGTAWNISGNNGTSVNNFIGTTDDNPFYIRINNELSGIFDSAHGYTFLGYKAGNITSTGSFFNNTGVGLKSLSSLTNGFHNTAFGSLSLSSNTEGYENTAIGYMALAASKITFANTAVGYKSLYSNLSGSYNTATGFHTLGLNESGQSNSAFGNNALGNNKSGSFNTACGHAALSFNTNGANNTAIGYHASYTNTSGFMNVSMGFEALRDNSSGNYNTAIGAKTLLVNTGGTGNTAIGYNALNANTTGNNNTVIGYQANVAAGNLSNATAIGYAASVGTSNRIVIGNNAVTDIGGYAGWSNLSDSRFKKNIKADIPGLSFILKLNPVSYNLDLRKLNEYTGNIIADKNKVNDGTALAAKESIVYSGFEAQEVEKAAAAANYSFSGVRKPQNDKDHYSIVYTDFIPSLVKALQEQQQIIEQLRKRIEMLEQK